MGDTFPQNLAIWDLRARYSSGVQRSTFIQDAGRLFKWRKLTASSPNLPELLLGLHAWDCFVSNEFDHEDNHLRRETGKKRARSKSGGANSGGAAAATSSVSLAASPEMACETTQDRRESISSISSDDQDTKERDAWEKADNHVESHIEPQKMKECIQAFLEARRKRTSSKPWPGKKDDLCEFRYLNWKVSPTESLPFWKDDFGDEPDFIFLNANAGGLKGKRFKVLRVKDVLERIKVKHDDADDEASRNSLRDLFEVLKEKAKSIFEYELTNIASDSPRYEFNALNLELQSTQQCTIPPPCLRSVSDEAYHREEAERR